MSIYDMPIVQRKFVRIIISILFSIFCSLNYFANIFRLLIRQDLCEPLVNVNDCHTVYIQGLASYENTTVNNFYSKS